MSSRYFGYVVAALSFAFSAQAFSQAQSQSADLECRYIFPIQQVYLTQHVKATSLDQTLRDRVVDQYSKKLDPTKVYLLKSDIEQIKAMMTSVFDKIKNKECVVLDEVQKLVISRIKERTEFAKKFLDKGYKFDSKVEFVFDPQNKEHPVSKEEAEAFLKKYIHFQVSNYLASDMKLPEAKTNVIKSWDRAIKKSGELKMDDIYAAYLDAFALALDPHSSFFSRDVNEDFQIQMSLSLEGIGATLSSTDGFTVIEALVPGGAAARSGSVMPQDKIISVGQGDKGPMENVIEMDLRDVVRKIRGAKGTKVRLLVLRKDSAGTNRFEVTLVRDKIKLEDEAASIKYIDKDVNGAKKKVGVLEFPSFYADSRRGGRSSAADLKKLVAEAREKKADALVLDLSTNGGGSLEDAVKIAGLFFATGNVVKQSSREEAKGEITLKDTDETVDWAGPLVVLTSRISASASEIVSGTLKDYKRAVVVGGDHTFGKGSVQTVMAIPPQTGEFGAVKITVGMFFTPGGFSTQHRGVEADIVLPGPYSLDDVGEKSLDYSLPPKQLPSFLSQDAYVKDGPGAWNIISADIIKQLAEKSKARVDKNEDFKKIVDEMNKAKKQGKLIKLAEVVKEKDKKKKAKAAKNASKEEKEKEYLKRADIQESVNVALDLLQVLGTSATVK